MPESDRCEFERPPIKPEAGGSVLELIVLDCESSGELVPAVIATHDQGDAAFADITQVLRLCTTLGCTETSTTWKDDLVASGEPEFFGEYDARPLPDLLEAVCSHPLWPVNVTLSDSTGATLNRTVCATVTDNR